MPRSEPDSLEAYKARIWEYAELHRGDPAAFPWKAAHVTEYAGCTIDDLKRHQELRDLFWNVRRIMSL